MYYLDATFLLNAKSFFDHSALPFVYYFHLNQLIKKLWNLQIKAIYSQFSQSCLPHFFLIFFSYELQFYTRGIVVEAGEPK